MPETYFGTPESRERDARFVGHEWKGDKMTDRVDREAVEQAIRAMAWAKRRGDGLVLAADEVSALLAERDAREAELKTLTTAGIAEVAARNPSVMEYMRHWEGRAEKAEADNQKLREAARPFVAALNQTILSVGSEDYLRQRTTANAVCQPYITMGHFFDLRAALAEQEKTDDQ